MKPLLAAATVTVGVLTLGACAVPHAQIGQPDPAPVVTVTQAPTTPTPEPVAPTSAPNPNDEFSDETADAALALTWKNMDAKQRALVCDLIDTNEQYAWQSFSKGADGKFTKAQFLAFFKRVC